MMSEKVVMEIKELVKDYGGKGFLTKVLKGIDLTIYKNDFIAIMGPVSYTHLAFSFLHVKKC